MSTVPASEGREYDPEHSAPAPRSDSFYADVRRGVKYAIARRAKLIPVALGGATEIVSANVLHGQALHFAVVVVSVLTFLATHQTPNAAAVATGPKQHERATQRGLPDHATPQEG